MNFNNRQIAPANAPRTLRPKAVPVSPIKSPLGGMVPQAVIPVISSQGQSPYMLSGNVVPQVYQGASMSQAMPGSQTSMTSQTLYPQSQILPGSQPRMALFPQSVAVSQNLPDTQLRISTPALYPQIGAVSQTVSGSQQRLSAQALYPQIGTQNLSASQSRMSTQVLYPQPVQIGTQMQVRHNSIPVVQSSIPVVQKSVPVAQNSIPMVQNSATMMVSAAPVFPAMSFQQGRQISFQTQINPQIQTGPQFAFQSQIASNVTSPVFSPTVTNVSNPFQQNYPGSRPVNLNPAYISAQNQGVLNQLTGQPVVQQNIAPRILRINQPQNITPNQELPVLKRSPDSRDCVTMNQATQNEQLSVPEQEGSSNSSSDSMFKILVKPATIIVKPAGTESKLEFISEPEELGEVFQADSGPEGMQVLQSDSDTYTEMTPDNSLIADAQFGSSEEKNFLQGSPLISSEQESLVMADSVTVDTQDSSSSGISNLVTGSEIDEILSMPPSFDTETAQTSQATVDFCDSALDSQYSEMTSMDGSMSQEDEKQQSYITIKAAESVVDQVDTDISVSIEPDRESRESVEVPNQIDEEVKDITPSQTDEDSVNNITDIGQITDRLLIDDAPWENSDLMQESSEAADEVAELKDTDSLHSNFVTETKTGASVVADTFCQVCSSENSQDGAMSSDVLDMYTDDSNSITWENFHQTVLNLRANKNRDKNEVVVNTARENSCDSNNLSCDKEYTDVSSKEDGENLVGQVKDDGSHEQSLEGDDEEPEFVWEDFLQQTGTSAVPATAFKHVEYSLQSGFIKGMKLEVPNKSDPSTYWVASVMMTCGPLLRLRYDGDKSSGDFWCDLNSTEVHPIGWSAQNDRSLQPPDDIRDRVNDWRSFLIESLTGARTAPAYFFEKGAALSPIEKLKCGMKLELQDALNPHHIWLVQILENVGGRLYLRLDCTQSASKHFWMFYLNHRLHPIGWGGEQEGCIYRPPKDIYDEQTAESWSEIRQTARKECEDDLVPEDVFKDQQELKPHQFAVGMKLEALIPGMSMIGPATVTKVINNLYFLVEVDDLRSEEQRESIQICCNSEYLGIFPISWCQCKGIRLSPPQGWKGGDFIWGEYLSFCNAKAAPEKLFHSGTDDHDFERGMKLEAVNPSNPNQICAATITKIVGPLLWIHLDHMRDIPSHIEDIDSHNLYPVGWCESNGYQLKPPVKAKPRQRHLSECKTEGIYRSVTSSQTKGAWCPKIHLNHRCFSGAFLSKGRISDLPKYVGPGPMDLVLKEVLGLLISIAYVPCRALKEIQQEGPFNPYMKAHILKAKYKGKKYKAVVEVCQNESQLEEYCRNMCIKLECCPYLFSPLHVRNSCPENCQQLTKTKSNPNYVKKRKPSSLIAAKPPVPQDGSAEPKKRGRKRKRFLYIQKKGHGQRQYDANGDLKDEGFIDDYDEDGLISTERKAYDIQTRGAKLPKYSFERKSHRKILMTHTITHVNKHKQGYKRLMGLKANSMDPDETARMLVANALNPKAWPVDEKPERPLGPREGSLKLESNPLNWTVSEVVQFLKTTDCSHLARIMKEQEVDGQAFLLLNLSAIQEHLELKLGPAVKLCHQIERLKLAFYENFA